MALVDFRKSGSAEDAITLSERLLACASPSTDVHLKILALFVRQLDAQPQQRSTADVRRAFEAAVQKGGASNVEIWIALAEFEYRHGNGNLGGVYQRALNSGLRDLSRLEDAIRTLS